MAEIFIRQPIDDLDEKPIDTGLGHEVTFSYQGADYRIDLRPINADKIEAAFACISMRRRRSPLPASPVRKRLLRPRRRVLVDRPSKRKRSATGPATTASASRHVGGSKPTSSTLLTPLDVFRNVELGGATRDVECSCQLYRSRFRDSGLKAKSAPTLCVRSSAHRVFGSAISVRDSAKLALTVM